MHVHFIIHEKYEGPGALTLWANDREYKQSHTFLYSGESLPQTQDFDLLVVLGGPQSPLTSIEQCAYFDVHSEVNFIKESIKAGKAILGVCLGAQLIGEALGATFEPSPHTEIGYFPITLSEAGKQNALLQHFQSNEVVGHWHNDMPGMTTNSKILAYSEGCPRQIVVYSDIVYGFQCHLEFTKQSVQGLIEFAFDEQMIGAEKWVQCPAQIIQTDTIKMNYLLFQFLDNLLIKYKAQ
jgi:GMP synthase (glutamine-hydrolysing)